ncbi:glycosyltransferase [Pontibacter silvestris]|uniref:Glycosyltransferase n=1 Tax=Pontibacter silvestris TaxID=2305183 RepID=A0ABW4X352_9BACT|nr:glycosyltransferase [Pontibacter silvestris]MCC9135066.1 glycosyltransferase [Pontibacter silvestris]
MKKVLHILGHLRYSGAEVMLALAAPYFREQGLDTHILSIGEEKDYAPVLEERGYTLHHIQGTKTLSYFIKLYKFLKEQRYDVVHIHPESVSFWHALTIKLAGSKSIVRTVHNVFQYQGFLRFVRAFQRIVARKFLSVKFFSIGPSVEEFERKHLFNETVVIPNWIDMNRFMPAKDEQEILVNRQKLGIGSDALVLVSVGASTEVKNQRDIITATANLLKQRKDIYYIHVGDGPLQPELKAYTAELGISDKVYFVGQTRQVREILIASDIFVMPSRFEGLGNSLLEALSCAVPAVVYNVYGLKDLVENKKNGYIVEQDPTLLENAIAKLADDKQMRKKMGKEARQKVLRDYDMKKSIDKMLVYY